MQLNLLGEAIEKKYKYVNGNSMKLNSNNILDQYFTKPSVAKKLFDKAKKIIAKHEKVDDFIWLEPSAGDGVFYNLFPENKRIGVDLHPMNDEIIQADYLKYDLPKDKKIIVMGNPPFGHRGVMALDFINHSQNADFVCFILPMFFESKGKGSVKYRVKGFNLLHNERLEKNSFYNPNTDKNIDVHCIFQIWSKNYKSYNDDFSWYLNKGKEPFSEYLKVFTVSLAKNRECGKHWIFNEKADFYISSTFYNQTEIVDEFEKVKYKSGIAVVFTTQNKEKRQLLLKIFKNTDWSKYGSLATNSCYHLGKSHIFEVVHDNLNLIKEA